VAKAKRLERNFITLKPCNNTAPILPDTKSLSQNVR